MKLLIKTEYQCPNLILDYANTFRLENNEYYYINYDIKLYDVVDNKEKLVATVNGIYFDVLYIIKNDLDLYEILNLKIKDTNFLENYLDYYGEIRGEYLSSFLNIYYIDKIKVETSYKQKNIDIFILKNIVDILMYKDKMLIGNILIKPRLDYQKKDNSIIENYKYEEKYDNLIKLYNDCGFESIDNTDYMILVNE